MGARVASSSFWGMGVISPSFSNVSWSRSAPSTFSRSKSSPAVSSGSTGVAACRRMSPVSMPSAMRMVVTPASSSPWITVHWMGAAPRYLGSRDPWTLTHPSGGTSSTALGKIFP